MCFAGTVVASRSLTQEEAAMAGSSTFTVYNDHIFVTECNKFNENIEGQLNYDIYVFSNEM